MLLAFIALRARQCQGDRKSVSVGNSGLLRNAATTVSQRMVVIPVPDTTTC